jgi:hypothetical protein
LLAACCLLAATVRAEAPSLLSHRAVYELSRHPSSTATDVAGVRGRLEVTLEGACDGWRLEQFLGFRIYHTEGGGLEHVAQLSGWESADGVEYLFSTTSYENRELHEEIGGIARLEAPGVKGETRYAKPTKQTKPLPEDTIFPTRHLLELIRAASAGERHLTRTVFDGSTLDSPYEITAFVGKENERTPADAPAAIAEMRSWPFRLAYFPVGAHEPSPDFEMSVTLYENGVAGDMIYDYGDFSIDVKLEEIEALPAASCPR